MTPRVFITNSAGHDFSNAKQFGELVWVTKGFVSFHSLDRLKHILSEKLQDTNKDDYLLLSGTQVICVVSALVWYEKHKQINILVHDKKHYGYYRKLTITQSNLEDIMKVVNDGTT